MAQLFSRARSGGYSRLGQVRRWVTASQAAGLVGACAVGIVLLGLRWSGALQPVELAAYDRMLGWRGAGEGPRSRVVQVAADEADITRFGWPLPDEVLAQAIRRLHEARARAIGIDIFRPTPVPPGTDQLAATLAEVPEIVWADRFGGPVWDALPPPAGAARGAGFADIVLDPSGIARRQLLVLGDGRRTQGSFALRLALLYLRAAGVEARVDAEGSYRLGSTALPRLEDDFGAYRGLDARGYQIMLELRAPRTLPRFTVGDLVDGRVPHGDIDGRIAVVGVIADSVKDTVIAPVGPGAPVAIAGVTLQGLAAAQLVAHGIDGLAPTHALPRAMETALLAAILVAGGLVGMFAAGSAWVLLLAGGGAIALVGAASFAILHGLWLPVAVMPLAWLGTIGAAKAVMSQAEATQRAFLMRLFSTHMSAPIAREMWERRGDFLRYGRPRPVRLEATVLFSDINDFTTISECMEPEDIVRWLEPYMTAMVDLIDAHGGCVERFSGDGILAMFGVPVKRIDPAAIMADAAAALACASAMGEAIVRLNDEYRAAGQPEIRFAVGIQSGTLVGCSLGSAERQQYTTMGDTTNTAARLVSVAKELMKRPGVEAVICTVVGSATRALVGERFTLRALGPVDLKGRAQRTECFVLGDVASVAATFASALKYG